MAADRFANPFRTSGPKMTEEEMIRYLQQLVIDLNAYNKELQARLTAAGIP